MEDEWNKYYGFDDFDENNLPEITKPGRWRKFAGLILTIILVLLFITSLAGGQWFIDLLQGQLVSDKIEDFQVEVNDNLSIIFYESTYNELLYYYLENQETEFKACLTGEIIDETYYITGIYWPEQYAEFNTVSYTPCNNSTIVSLHSHPYKQCTASEQDIETAKEYKEQNPKAIMAILCEPARLTFYEV